MFCQTFFPLQIGHIDVTISIPRRSAFDFHGSKISADRGKDGLGVFTGAVCDTDLHSSTSNAFSALERRSFASSPSFSATAAGA